MGREIAVRAPALVLTLSLLAPLHAEADYRFEDGVYLGPARLMVDWSEALDRASRQRPVLEACLDSIDACEGSLRGLNVLVERARELSLEQQLRLINRYINKRRYRGDRSTHRYSELAEEDVLLTNRWATLVEFMRHGGDCEDYATSKYQLLRALGVPADDLRVVVVYDRTTREHHAVLAVRQPAGAAWLLDSDDRIHRGQPFGYRFVYALNETSIWDHELDQATWLELAKLEEAS